MTVEDFIWQPEDGENYFEVWNDMGELVLTTWSRSEAHEVASFCLRLWEERPASTSVRTVSGGAFEMNRSKH